MNKGRLIGGIICLALAALLGILNLTLEPDNLMFMIGDENMPWIPPLILGVVGIILLATANLGGRSPAASETQATAPQAEIDPDKAALNKRMETIAWGLFLIMLGGFMFVPEEFVSGGFWPIAVGLIMLGLNAARYFNGIRMSGFTTALGIISVIGGILELAGWSKLEGSILLIILGAYLILKPWFEKRQLFGKAEYS